MTRILVVEDEAVVRDLMLEILADAGYDVVGAGTGDDALDLLEDESVDLVVSDIVMPGLSGHELLERVRETRPSLPVILVTGAGTFENLSAALTHGAAALVLKPFSHAELNDAVATALHHARRTEGEVRDRLLAPALAAALANAIEARDQALYGHCERLAELAVRLASTLGLSRNEIDAIRLGAILHDVGKIGIPDRVLQSRRKFGLEERALMRTHPLIGDRLLEPLDLLHDVRPIVRHHHERFDGTGYPDGLAGDAIPFAARVVAVADAIEAMSAERPYRPARPHDEIVRELEENRGTQWDADVVDAALALIALGELTFGPEGLQLAAADGGRRATRFPVLLVEDDPDHALLATEAIEDAVPGVHIVHAPDVATAAALARGSTWALALVDHQLPDGTGLEVLSQLRAVAPRLPVVMLTGLGSEALAVEAFRHGASDYVIKGEGSLTDLTQRVRSLLEAA